MRFGNFHRLFEDVEGFLVFAGRRQTFRHANVGVTATDLAAGDPGRTAVGLDRLGHVAMYAQQLALQTAERV